VWLRECDVGCALCCVCVRVHGVGVGRFLVWLVLNGGDGDDYYVDYDGC